MVRIEIRKTAIKEMNIWDWILFLIESAFMIDCRMLIRLNAPLLLLLTSQIVILSYYLSIRRLDVKASLE